MRGHVLQSARRVVAVCTIFGIGLAGTPLWAAGQFAVRKDGSLANVSEPVHKTPENQLRERARSLRRSVLAARDASRWDPAAIDAILLRLDIAEARSGEEQRRLVQQLPVTVTTTRTSRGTTHYYIAGGKIRLEHFIPLRPSPRLPEPEEPASGPSAESEASSQMVCYDDDNQPDECATDQEIAEGDMIAADAVATAAWAEAEHQHAIMVMGCCAERDVIREEAPVSGPSAEAHNDAGVNCVDQAAAALLAAHQTYQSYADYIAAKGRAAAIGTKLAKKVLSRSKLALGVAAAATLYFTYSLISCAARQPAVQALDWFEPYRV